jgi:hypothetical protein
MTHKEKAKELVDKFIELTGTSDEYLYSKAYALIAVDEILKLVSDDLDLYYKDCIYWEQVKTEIEAL